jgi:uncharacterized protein with NRDE domain
VTNQRALDQAPAGARSRGLAVRELAETDAQDAYVDALDPRDYASMNLVWGDAQRVRIGYLRRDGSKDIITLARGAHVLCNDRIGAPGFPRGERLAQAIEVAVADGGSLDMLAPRLQRALADHTRVPIEEVPPSHLPAALARELTATCIHSEYYGTRSSTILALDRGSVAAYLHADGSPCTTPFIDRKGLFA